MLLRGIIRRELLASQDLPTNKIVHELNNEGCKCNLCQKVVVNETRVIKQLNYEDKESQMTKGKRIEYFSRFLNDYFFIDKQPRKIKFVVPELCFFEKGVPVALISKRREIAQLRIIKNKEKLNAFEIENFFIDGYVFHNNYQSKLEKQDDGRFKNLSKDHFYNFRELLKTESLVLVKFKNDSCQMMNLTELDNLFKSKQRATRMDVVSVATMVSAVDCNETRVHINFNQLTKSPLLERAKNQAKIINEDIKAKDFLFTTEREERIFEDELKAKDEHQYLQYISMKLLLLYSLRADILLKSCLLKFTKDQTGYYCLTDIQAYSQCPSSELWGQPRIAQQKTESPKKATGLTKPRPSSSPDRLQKKIESQDNKVIKSSNLIPESIHPKKPARDRIKTLTLLKLQPIMRQVLKE